MSQKLSFIIRLNGHTIAHKTRVKIFFRKSKKKFCHPNIATNNDCSREFYSVSDTVVFRDFEKNM
jgi:hypothetical protein